MPQREYKGGEKGRPKTPFTIPTRQVRSDLNQHLVNAILYRDHADQVKQAQDKAKEIIDGLTLKERDWVYSHVAAEGLDTMTYGTSRYLYYLGVFGYLERLDKCWQGLRLARVDEHGITWEKESGNTGSISYEPLDNKAKARLIKVEKSYEEGYIIHGGAKKS